MVEIGLRRLREDLTEYFPDVLVDIPIKLTDLKESNPLHAWIKSLVWNEADGSNYHSTYDPTIKNTREGMISYITSNIAYDRYAFRRCGLPAKEYGITTTNDRKHINN